nr:glutathione S-transferase sigma 14 [Brachionus rubens]
MGCGSSNPQNVVEPGSKPGENTQRPQSARPKSGAQNRVKSASQSQHSNNYVLNYFDLSGRGELIRLVFAAGNIDYEDNRVKFEEWPQIKDYMPLGQLPTLQVNDEPLLVQSLSIARFVAKEAGLAGRDSEEMAKVDSVLETCKEFVEEFVAQLGPQLRNPTDEKNQIVDEFFASHVPENLERIQRLVELYGSNGYSVGDQLTVADLFIHDILTNLIELKPFVLDDYQLLKENRTTTENNQHLKSYLNQRRELRRNQQ